MVRQPSKGRSMVVLKSLSTSLILRGILALAVGVMALAWPGVTVFALIVLFAVYAFMASGLEAVRAFSSRTGGPVLRHLLVGLIDLAAGLVALAWPGPTALVLVLIVASWAVIAGLVEVSAAFGNNEPAGSRTLFILGGLVSVAFGAVLFAHPGVGAITLALLFGLFNLVFGARALVQGIELRRTRNPGYSPVQEQIRHVPRPATRTAPRHSRRLGEREAAATTVRRRFAPTAAGPGYRPLLRPGSRDRAQRGRRRFAWPRAPA
jgi:uncharacterized membrane protein HdeD (DUF308 family)